MRIHTLWHEGDTDCMPYLIDAADEYLIDENGEPESYIKHRLIRGVRELIIDIPDGTLKKLFSPLEVKGKVIDDDEAV